jgi:hypothetical protein
MQITIATPPVVPTRRPRRSLAGVRRSYSILFDALANNPGSWVAISPQDVTGDTTAYKNSVLAGCAKSRNVKIETTHQNGLIYVRLMTDVHHA